MKLSSLSILIPTYNDGNTIAKVITEAQKAAKKNAVRYEILVCNDGSVDDTARVLQKMKQRNATIHILTHRKNKGYGMALFHLYSNAQYEWLFTVPGDYQIDPMELSKLCRVVRTSDIVIGVRKHRQDNAKRIFQSKIYHFLLRILFGLRVHDVNSVKLLKRSVIRRLPLRSRTAFIEAELVICALKQGVRIQEVFIRHKKREVGIGGGGKWSVISSTLLDLLRLFFHAL